MKKSALDQHKNLLYSLLILGIVALITALFQLNQNRPQISSQNTYGPMGYGRGQNAQSDQSSQQGQQNQQLNKDNCLMDGCLLVDDAEYPVAELDKETISYLETAIADEYKALATYEAVMDKFGKVRPFINIARAEEQHISMLKALFDKYGLEIPKDQTKVAALPSTLAEVCQIGVQAEIDNDALYQEMLPNITQEDIKTVFTSLADASREMHLPAFERCAQ